MAKFTSHDWVPKYAGRGSRLWLAIRPHHPGDDYGDGNNRQDGNQVLPSGVCEVYVPGRKRHADRPMDVRQIPNHEGVPF
jgi:hypothetical protein